MISGHASLAQQVLDGRLQLARVVRPVSVDFEAEGADVPSVRCTPGVKRGMGTGQPAVLAPVYEHGRLSCGSLDAAALASWLEAPGDLHAEVDRHRRLGTVDVLIEEDVVAVGAGPLVLT